MKTLHSLKKPPPPMPHISYRQQQGIVAFLEHYNNRHPVSVSGGPNPRVWYRYEGRMNRNLDVLDAEYYCDAYPTLGTFSWNMVTIINENEVN
jgi:hypothetical protein